jgi:hypothetical protein
MLYVMTLIYVAFLLHLTTFRYLSLYSVKRHDDKRIARDMKVSVAQFAAISRYLREGTEGRANSKASFVDEI